MSLESGLIVKNQMSKMYHFEHCQVYPIAQAVSKGREVKQTVKTEQKTLSSEPWVRCSFETSLAYTLMLMYTKKALSTTHWSGSLYRPIHTQLSALDHFEEAKTFLIHTSCTQVLSVHSTTTRVCVLSGAARLKLRETSTTKASYNNILIIWHLRMKTSLN